MDETIQAANHQSARLKSDLRFSQQERDSLKHDVAVLNKRLQNVNDKVRSLKLFFTYRLKKTLKCNKHRGGKDYLSFLQMIFKDVLMYRQDNSTSFSFFQLNFCICSSQNHVLEMALHSSGLQNQSKKLYRGEMSRLMEKDQQLLRQENERLQAEVRSIKGDLVQSREKVS